jgi:hypothetical protein
VRLDDGQGKFEEGLGVNRFDEWTTHGVVIASEVDGEVQVDLAESDVAGLLGHHQFVAHFGGLLGKQHNLEESLLAHFLIFPLEEITDFLDSFVEQNLVVVGSEELHLLIL